MIRFLIGTIILGLFISCGDCNSQQNNLSYFDCNYYHYFQDTAYPKLSKQDTLNLIKSAIRYGYIEQAIKGRDTLVRNTFHLLPIIQNKIDTGWYSFLHSEDRDKFSFRSLNHTDIYPPIKYDATIIGKVIDKIQPIDSSKCLRYKTQYVIEVIDIIHSYFPLKEGDLVLVMDVMGYECGSSIGNEVFGDYDHIREYVIGGEKSVFSLTHVTQK